MIKVYIEKEGTMTKREKTHQDPRKLLRGIVIPAGLITVTFGIPRATRTKQKQSTKGRHYEKG